MREAGNLDYAQARLQARHGQRMRPSDWARLDASRDLQHFLATAATSPLVRWTSPLNPEMNAHELERALRKAWREYVAEICDWLPAAWQSTAAWSGTLVDLQYVARLADPTPAPSWMFADPVYGSIAPGSPAERAAAMAATPLAPLAPALLGLNGVVDLWVAEWQRRQPPVDADAAASLRALARILAGAALTRPEGRPSGHATEGSMRDGISRLFRHAAGTPVSAFAHLALVADDLRMLRGRVVERAAFGIARRAA
ncbi:MAG TPA: hypothetical protein VLT59_13650 [Steroidobacteraceae bacterium]|nr:hypothetical protein [Steroidobacteraceae bacterium]